MTHKKQILYYSFGALLLFTLDRITKSLALSYCVQQCTINPFLTFQLTLNRGISWGMLHTESAAPFSAITIAVILLTIAVGYVMYSRYKRNRPFLGELLVCVGSFSNIIDRLLYNGVIDFIKLTYYNIWAWPIFNIADVCIVLGVIIMLIQTAKE